MDVSTCDEDYDNRIFGSPCDYQIKTTGGYNRIPYELNLLCIEDSRNF